ncbi:glycosyltransferase family 2 protein [Reichenbachiella ulvae]|uniref:Glycosyltransferase n=1 Tax=Reichenbachiella ulvae TaxID=2980104 RepID=A0ABT3CW03_9BACT|nr:glycosyltransferase [Reichenbachiella ulvae]MCV9387724.1 glycosyltransferase [Reichenbachiella ulvae]
MDQPLVSVICLCYNHVRFVLESLESVLNQSYRHIEMIIVDDASSDGSKEIIQNFLEEYPDVPFINLPNNVGNTTAFNQGLKMAKGKYVIDLACDDVMLPDRIEKQVAFFETQHERVGVIYSDAEYIDEEGKHIKFHFKKKRYEAKEGDIYKDLIGDYFIPPPTMMMRKKVLDELDGYDEDLAYEDFDFWIRSSKMWHYAFQPELLTKIRKVTNSLSTQLYTKTDLQLNSTIMVCEKIMELNQEPEEDRALVKRLKYEVRHAFLTGHRDQVMRMMEMLRELKGMTFLYYVLSAVNLGWNLTWLRRLIHLIKYG